NVIAKQPVSIGLVVDLVSDADEEGPACAGTQLSERFADGRLGQVDPSDHPGDEIGAGGGDEKLAGLVHAGDRLDQDGPIDAGGRQQGPEVLRPETTPDARQLVAHPWVIAARGIPEVVVRVDYHWSSGVGASNGKSPWAFRSCHNT